jgi:hypothetical protein
VQSVIDSTSTRTAAASCPAGKKAISGGAEIVGNSVKLALANSLPTGGGPGAAPTGWSATAQETSSYSGTWSVKVYVVCATTS